MTSAPEAPAEERTFSARVKRTFTGWGNRLRRAARWMAGGGIGALTAVLFFYPQGHSSFPSWVRVITMTAGVALPAAFFLFMTGLMLRLGRFRESDLTVVGDELVVRRAGKVQRYALERFASGIVVPRGLGADVQLRMINDNELVVRMASLASADSLLDALGLGATRRRTDVAWTPVLSTMLMAWFGIGFVFTPFFALIQSLRDTPFYAGLTPLWLFLPWVLVGAIVRLRHRNLTIGQDGVVLKKNGRTRSWSFERLQSVRSKGMFLTFVSDDGEEPLIVDASRGGVELARAIEAQVGEALEAFKSGARADHARFLRPAGETFASWVDGLRNALREEASFRSSPMRAEDALRVVEDPRASAEARVGAAIALAEAGSEEARLRVRVAMQSTVRPKVRVALERALVGEAEESLIEAAEAEQRELDGDS